MARLGEHQHRAVGLNRGDQVFILSGNVKDLDPLQIHLRIVGKILKPRQNVGIGKEILFHA